MLASAPVAQAQHPSEARQARVVRDGGLNLAIFLPQYSKDPKTGELKGDAPIVESARALADRLRVRLTLVEQPTPGKAIECLSAGRCNLAFMGSVPSRAAHVDFSPPLFELDYSLLVPAGSPIRRFKDADGRGLRIAAVRNHASTLTLERLFKQAEFVYAETPDPTFELLRSGRADAFASVAYALHGYVPQLPGSRVLEGRYGANPLSLAVPKGNPGWLDYVSDFVKEAKASGLAKRAIAAGGMKGIHVAK